jgi:FAD binding domain/Berberine and berberine like
MDSRTLPADSRAVLRPARLDHLARSLRGRLITPEDADYDLARRVWNGAVDRRPAAIARCLGAEDVRLVLEAAREAEAPLAVRGGGHSIPGHSVCDGGLVIDLGGMREVRVDPEARTVCAEAGLTWTELDEATQAVGLATTGGQVGTTGIAGLTLGGGLGWLMRVHGLTCDNLLAVELVTAGGELIRASERENRDLFWGLRGGGGNLGVALAFEYRLHPVRSILGGLLAYGADLSARLLRLWREAVAGAPDECNSEFVLSMAPDQPLFPEHLRRRPMASVWVCWPGDHEAGQRFLDRFRRALPPQAELVWPMTYGAMQLLQQSPAGLRRYHKSHFLGGLSDGAIDAIAELGTRLPADHATLVLHNMEGAVSRVPTTATAFSHRSARFFFDAASAWTHAAEDADHRAWVSSLWTALRSDASGVYVNFLEEEGERRVRSAYGPATYRRLAELKARYDPDNLFRLNQNVPPAGR